MVIFGGLRSRFLMGGFRSRFSLAFVPAFLTRRPAERSTAENVQMQMEYALPCTGSVVHHHSKCFFDSQLTRNLASREQQVPEQRLRLSSRLG